MVKSNTIECISCHKRYKTLTNEKICYYCYLNKYKSVPTTGIYAVGKVK
jgi:hypothetical protein